MLSIFKKIFKKSNAIFKVLEPNIKLTVSVSECINELKIAGVKYNQVSAGYITFPAKLFNGLDMMVGLHYQGPFIDYIEIFRPLEYYNSPNFDINESYAEIHDAVSSCYGQPQAKKPAYLSGYPSERWLGRNFVIDHSICERFCLEEHLSFRFIKP